MPHFGDSTQWLLPPVSHRELIDIEKSCRVNTHVLFLLIEQAVFHITVPQLDDYSQQLKDDCIKVLALLEVLDESGYPGARVDDCRRAWLNDDRDWFHGQFMAIQMYREVIEIIRSGAWEEFQGHHGCYLTLARRLGQVARLDFNQNLMAGVQPLSRSKLIDGMNMLLPSTFMTVSVYTMCRVLCRAFHVTPARLERALLMLREDWHAYPREDESSRKEPGIEETIIDLSVDGFAFKEVSSGKFKMRSTEGIVSFTQVC